MSVASAQGVRVRVRVEGTVQGVGFRPYVYRVATELGLAGHVLNDAHGVLAEVEGPAAAVDAFLNRLAPEAPPLAVIEQVRCEPIPCVGAAFGFDILASPRGAPADAPVTGPAEKIGYHVHRVGGRAAVAQREQRAPGRERIP